MSDILVVNFASLQKASEDIQRALNALQGQLTQLDDDARPLVQTWEGEAQQAYDQRQRQWTSASQDLQTMLQDIKRAVDESAADYLHTEKKNTGLFQ
ncbi:WXG100 family type VII secretion target [Micromonospora sp. NPDC049559]|uniref:WXG100 family type VII secretion target n=1 Tax=Micromonospora sp. NPDC049559 TaxID=3155923 RepID=UPI00343AAA1B